MGIAKYLEDIQKRRDEWRHLSRTSIDLESVLKNQATARKVLEGFLDDLNRRSEAATCYFDELLELATDPSVRVHLDLEDAQKLNFESKRHIDTLERTIMDLRSQLSSLEKAIASARNEISSMKNILANRDSSILQLMSERENAFQEIKNLKATIAKLTSVEANNSAFDDEMRKFGVKAHRKS